MVSPQLEFFSSRGIAKLGIPASLSDEDEISIVGYVIVRDPSRETAAASFLHINVYDASLSPNIIFCERDSVTDFSVHSYFPVKLSFLQLPSSP